MNCAHTAALAAALLLLVPANATANDASFSFVGGNPRLLNETSVAMVSEHLVFRYRAAATQPGTSGGRCDEFGGVEPEWEERHRLCPTGWYCYADGLCHRGRGWTAELTYVFENRGDEARDLVVGLPFRLPNPADEEGDWFGPTVGDEIEGFVTLLNGQPAPVERVDREVYEDDISFNRVYATLVHFEPGQTHQLVHRYESFVSIGSAGGGSSYRYMLRTGRGWAGPIGSVRIDFQLPPDNGPCATANLPYERDGDWIRVALSDVTPERDFEVIWEGRDYSLGGRFAPIWDLDGAEDPATTFCAPALSAAPQERALLADHLELFYGAPAEDRLAAARDQGPIFFCAWADMFHMLAFDSEIGAEQGYDVSRMAYQPSPLYPENMPPFIRECLARLRAPAEVPRK